MRHRIAAVGYCGNAHIVAMPVLLQCPSILPQCLFQCSHCCNIAAMLMLLAMPFHIAVILKRIAAMLPLLHHCGNIAIIKGIVAMPFGIATTPQYFRDAMGASSNVLEASIATFAVEKGEDVVLSPFAP